MLDLAAFFCSLELLMKLKALLAFALTVSILAQTVAQEPEKRRDVIRTDTNLVQIDVIVSDKTGKQVTDLRPEDFEVIEDGKKQQVTNFSYVGAERFTGAEPDAAAKVDSAKKTAEPVGPARLKREQVRRTVALVIDDLGLSLESFDYARQALAKFVDEQMQPNDLVAVLRTSAGVGVLQQFSSDKRQLHAAIERVRWNPLGRSGISPVGTMNEQSIGADIRDNIQFTEEMEESRAAQYSVGTIGTINAVVRGMGDLPGRKSIVLISEAFRMFTAQGRNVALVQALRQITDDANANSVAIYTIDASGLQSYTFEASDKVAGYSYLIDPQALAASGGPGTGGGAGGVRVNPPPRTLPRADTLSAQAEQDSGAAFRRLAALTEMRNQQAGQTYTVLSYLAERTGGIFERNRNDLGSSIERIMADQQGYYLIGYRPDPSSMDSKGSRRLHSLSVKVKRSGLKVRSRDGYFGVSDEDRRGRPRTRAERLTAALTSPFASGDIRIQLTSLFGDEPDGGGSYLRSLLHIDAKDLTFREEPGGARTAELEMVAVAFGDNGQIVDQLSYPQTVRAMNATDYERMLKDGLVYILNFPLKKGGAYQMRVAVLDAASERNGTAMQFVEAPDLTKDRLALSGIVLSNAAEVDKASAAEQDIQSGPAVRRLRPGMMIDYRFIIYNARADENSPVQLQMRLLREGKAVFTGKVASLDVSKERNAKRISTGGRLRMGPDLTPGDYVLHVVVKNTTDPKKPRIASQWIDFEIVN
jgi:VWFA-related protein